MEKMAAYREKVQAQLKEWQSMVDLLQARAEKAKASAKIEILTEIEQLEGQMGKIEAKLSEMQTSGDEAWKNIQEGTEKAVAQLKSAFDEALEKFK